MWMWIAGCGADPDAQGSPTVGVLRRALEDELLPAQAGYWDAAERLGVVVLGGPADGVTLSTFGAAHSGTVSADLDGDGFREESVSVDLEFGDSSLALTSPVQVSMRHGLAGYDLVTIGGQVAYEEGLFVATAGYGSVELDGFGLSLSDGEATLSEGAPMGDLSYEAVDADGTDPITGTMRVEGAPGALAVTVTVDGQPEATFTVP